MANDPTDTNAAAAVKNEEDEEQLELAAIDADKLEDFASAQWRAHSKHYFVLSTAGKPIYTRYGDEAQLAPLMSTIQAVIASFADMSDPIRSMTMGGHTIVFYTSGPLYLMAVASVDEPAQQLRSELQLLHSQIVSILTMAQLTKIFEQRSNFDLRQLLGGTEPVIDQLVDRMATSFAFSLGSLDTLWMRFKLRDRIGKSLLAARPKGLLYAMLVADLKLVTLMRPRKHSLHPSDLMLLFNMAANRAFLTGEHWTPVCLPRFNDQGFLHVYVNYVTPNAALLLVSADRDSFPAMSGCCEAIVADLSSDGSLQRLEDAAVQRALHPSELGVRGLLHMHYKHKALVQNFGSCFDDSVPERDQMRIMSTYKRLRLHMVGNMAQPL
ncbi:Vacuolar fusion protein mon1, partial [Linderina pennispora]